MPKLINSKFNCFECDETITATKQSKEDWLHCKYCQYYHKPIDINSLW